MEPLAKSLESGLAKLHDRIHVGAAELTKRLTISDDTQAQITQSLTQVWAGQADVSSRMESVNSRLENIAGSISADSSVGANMASLLEMAHKSSEVGERLLAAQEQTQKLAQRNEEVLLSKINAKFSGHDDILTEKFDELREVFMANLAKVEAGLARNATLTRPEESANQQSVETKTLQDVERIRADLKRVESQLSKVENVPSSLQRIYELSLLIQETSKYMEKEEDWIKKRLGEHAPDLDIVEVMGSSTSLSSTSQSSNYPAVCLSSSSQGSTGSDSSESQARKVIVHSPGPRVDSPLRVSTAQEQRRRRESGKPKSILKGSQDRAPTTKLPCKSTGSSINAYENTIDNIRSTFVQSPLAKKAHGFTSIAEYMVSNKAMTSRRDHARIGDLAEVGSEVGNSVAITAIAAVV